MHSAEVGVVSPRTDDGTPYDDDAGGSGGGAGSDSWRATRGDVAMTPPPQHAMGSKPSAASAPRAGGATNGGMPKLAIAAVSDKPARAAALKGPPPPLVPAVAVKGSPMPSVPLPPMDEDDSYQPPSSDNHARAAPLPPPPVAHAPLPSPNAPALREQGPWLSRTQAGLPSPTPSARDAGRAEAATAPAARVTVPQIQRFDKALPKDEGVSFNVDFGDDSTSQSDSDEYDDDAELTSPEAQPHVQLHAQPHAQPAAATPATAPVAVSTKGVVAQPHAWDVPDDEEDDEEDDDDDDDDGVCKTTALPSLR